MKIRLPNAVKYIGITVPTLLVLLFVLFRLKFTHLNNNTVSFNYTLPDASSIHYSNFKQKVYHKFKNDYVIKKIIHQSWKTKSIPNAFIRYYPSWQKCFPSWEHKLWTDEDNRKLIAENYPWFLEKYDSFPLQIYRADCARYVYMFHFGGVYTDLDNECLFPFEPLLVNYSLVFGAIDHVNKLTPLPENYVQNSFMYSRPRHPIWIGILLDIMNLRKFGRADQVTGPEVLSNAIHKYRLLYPTSHGIKIYSARYFNPITWGYVGNNPRYCKTHNKMTEEEYKQCRLYHIRYGSYVVQYHLHSWG